MMFILAILLLVSGTNVITVLQPILRPNHLTRVCRSGSKPVSPALFPGQESYYTRSGYHLDGQFRCGNRRCLCERQNVCKCPASVGFRAVGERCQTHGEQHCFACKRGYRLVGRSCDRDSSGGSPILTNSGVTQTTTDIFRTTTDAARTTTAFDSNPAKSKPSPYLLAGIIGAGILLFLGVCFFCFLRKGKTDSHASAAGSDSDSLADSALSLEDVGSIPGASRSNATATSAKTGTTSQVTNIGSRGKAGLRRPRPSKSLVPNPSKSLVSNLGQSLVSNPGKSLVSNPGRNMRKSSLSRSMRIASTAVPPARSKQSAPSGGLVRPSTPRVSAWPV